MVSSQFSTNPVRMLVSAKRKGGGQSGGTYLQKQSCHLQGFALPNIDRSSCSQIRSMFNAINKHQNTLATLLFWILMVRIGTTIPNMALIQAGELQYFFHIHININITIHINIHNIHMYIYIYMYVYIYIYAYTNTNTYTYYTYTYHIHIHLYIYTSIHLYIYIYVYIQIYTYKHVHLYI